MLRDEFEAERVCRWVIPDIFREKFGFEVRGVTGVCFSNVTTRHNGD